MPGQRLSSGGTQYSSGPQYVPKKPSGGIGPKPAVYSTPQPQGQIMMYGGNNPLGAPAAAPPPPTANVNAPVNPQLNALMGEWGNYQNQLAANTDMDAVNALRRMTAMTDRRVKMAGSGVMHRLGAGSGVQEKVMARTAAQGMSDMSAANSQLAQGGRQAQLGALQGKTSTGIAMAADQHQSAAQGMQLAQQRMDYDRWDAERNDRINQQGFLNNYQMLQFAAQPQTWRG